MNGAFADTLGVLCRTMGEHFRPLVAECLQLALSLMDDASDPDLRRCMYASFAVSFALIHLCFSQLRIAGCPVHSAEVRHGASFGHYGHSDGRCHEVN